MHTELDEHHACVQRRSPRSQKLTMYRLSDTDREFRAAFDAGTISPDAFDHRAHLRLAYVHLAEHGPEAALESFPSALLSYLAARQIDVAKFHATLTQAWLRAVWHFMQRAGATPDAATFVASSPALHHPDVMLTHYSRERLFSPEARAAFLSPDREPIPSV